MFHINLSCLTLYSHVLPHLLPDSLSDGGKLDCFLDVHSSSSVTAIRAENFTWPGPINYA